MQRGFFITLEGGEGGGKSTQIPVIKDFLEARGFKVECTREPGGTAVAEQIRSILLNPDHEEKICSTTELLLMYAARAQLVNSKIKPLLEQGTVVISDRFDLSTIAYQGYGRGMDLDLIGRIREVAIGDFNPDLIMLFDIDVKEGMMRAGKRSAADRFEQESLDFFERVREGFTSYASAHEDLIKVIDGAQNIDGVSSQVKKVLSDFIDRRG